MGRAAVTACDFVGSTIDGKNRPLVNNHAIKYPFAGESWKRWIVTKREGFALGCGIYKIIVWKAPFPEMTEKQVEEKYVNEEFPDTEGLLVGVSFTHAGTRHSWPRRLRR